LFIRISSLSAEYADNEGRCETFLALVWFHAFVSAMRAEQNLTK